MIAKMTAETYYQAGPGWLKAAVQTLRDAGAEVFAPVRGPAGTVDLAPVTAGEQIALDYVNVQTPLKRLFLPPTETLLDYRKKDSGEMEVRPAPLPDGEVFVLGVRPCDAVALEALDKVFQWDYDDLRYRARRERTTLVTFACRKAGPECFCTSVGVSPHDGRESDVLAFLPEDGSALLAVRSEKGQHLMQRLGDAVRPLAEPPPSPVPPRIERKFDPEKVKAWLDANFENPFWAEQAMRCLGCGACSYLCPTCHCFDIVDEAAWNQGRRQRNWDCCSFALFTRHASGHNPRPTQAARYRQRLMHKFKYFPERFGRLACVGCGRCVRTCGAGLDLRAALAEIQAG